MSTFLNDTFNDTNGTALASHTADSGATWAKSSSYNGGAATLYNSGGGVTDAYSSGSASAAYLASGTPAGTNYTITTVFRLDTAVGYSVGPTFRCNSTGSDFYTLVYAIGDQKFELYRSTSGTIGPLLASFAYTFAAGTVTVVVRVTGITAVSIAVDVGSTSNAITYTDNAPTTPLQSAGVVGLWFWSPSATTGTTGVHIAQVTAVDNLGLASGTASLSSATVAAVNLTCGAASGGTGPYTYQWCRSTTSGFTPGGGNILSGATTLSYADTTAAAGTLYYYKLQSTDSAGSPATVTSNQVAGQLLYPAVSIGAIGDSIYAGTHLSAGQDPLTQCGLILQKLGTYHAVVATNQAVGGTMTQDWLPTGSLLGPAKAAFAAASPPVTHVLVMLGANDASAGAPGNHTSAATYLANLTSIVNNLVAAGYKVVLSYPTYFPPGAYGNYEDETSVDLARQYRAQIDTQINGTTILAGDKVSPGYFADNLGEYLADQLHPSAVGSISLGNMLARVMDRVLNPAGHVQSRVLLGM